MDIKLKLKLGEVDIEYEGPEEFVKSELPILLEKAAGFRGDARSRPGHAGKNATSPQTIPDMTTSSIAAKLGVKTGSDLIVAAAACLNLAKGAEKFTREELLKEMQTAPVYYKTSFSRNFSKYLASQIKDQTLSEPAVGSFTLSAKARSDLVTKLAHA